MSDEHSRAIGYIRTMKTNREITMTELVELATLDAFGLLPPADAVKFERAFMAAPADVQAELRKLQSDFAEDEQLLPSEDADPLLKDRVLAAVSHTIEIESDRLAPLATIGHPHNQELLVPNPGNNTSTLMAPTTANMRPLASVWTWRMAALILLGITISLAIFGSDAYRQSKLLANAYIGAITIDDIEQRVGPQYTAFVANPNCQIHYLVGPNNTGMLRVAINENTGEAFIIGMDLDPANGNSELRLVSNDGSIHSLAMVNTDEPVVGQFLESINVSLFTANTFDRLELVSSNGTVIMQSV